MILDTQTHTNLDLGLMDAITQAKENNAPTLISCKTKIGYGSPNKESKSSSHGSPLGDEEITLTRKNLGWTNSPFEIPKELLSQWRNFYLRNLKKKEEWLENNKNTFSSQAFKNIFNHYLDKNIIDSIHKFKSKHIKENTSCATRKASELSIELFNDQLDNLIGGSADLTGSNNTKTKNMKVYDSLNYDGNYIYYGVREHAMAAIINGIALHGGLRPYGGTFLVFTDYCRPSIRLSALMKLPSIFVMTHDSIGLGEDGPTHQPVEHLASLRAMPNLKVFRPCDIIETIESWQIALESENPSVIVLTRQNLPLIRKENFKENLVEKGAYIIRNFGNYDATILATGSEVEIAQKASEELEKYQINARVISIPCFELFDSQSKKYKKQILGSKLCYGIEAGVINGWEKYIDSENFIGMKTFGASGPYKELYKYFGITVDNLVESIKKNLD